MVLSLSMVNGFEGEITEKAVGFQGHIQVRSLDLNTSKELTPFEKMDSFENWVKRQENIKSIYPTIYKHGIAKSNMTNEGLIFKGVGKSFNSDFFEKNILYGRFPKYSDTSDNLSCIISINTAKTLSLDTGKHLDVFFIHEGKVRRRRFDIVGIYSTGFEERDEKLVICDLSVLQRILSNDYRYISAYEIVVPNLSQAESISQFIDERIDYSKTAVSIISDNTVLFQWLKVVHSNIYLILILVLLVASINMATTTLILILDRSQFIGILKTLGLENKEIIKLFLRHGLLVNFIGFSIGAILSLLVIIVQNKFQLLTLDSSIYYMSYIPMKLHLSYFLQIFSLLMGSSFFTLLLPVRVISSLRPSKVLRFS